MELYFSCNVVRVARVRNDSRELFDLKSQQLCLRAYVGHPCRALRINTTDDKVTQLLLNGRCSGFAVLELCCDIVCIYREYFG